MVQMQPWMPSELKGGHINRRVQTFFQTSHPSPPILTTRQMNVNAASFSPQGNGGDKATGGSSFRSSLSGALTGQFSNQRAHLPPKFPSEQRRSFFTTHFKEGILTSFIHPSSSSLSLSLTVPDAFTCSCSFYLLHHGPIRVTPWPW